MVNPVDLLLQTGRLSSEVNPRRIQNRASGTQAYIIHYSAPALGHCSSTMNSEALTKYTATLLMNRDERTSAASITARSSSSSSRRPTLSLLQHCRIRLIKAIRSAALPYSGNYAAVRPTDRPTEYRIVSSNFSAPRSTIHQHACACPDSACSVSLARYGGSPQQGREASPDGRPRPHHSLLPVAVIVITSLPPPIFHPILRPLCPTTELQRRASVRDGDT